MHPLPRRARASLLTVAVLLITLTGCGTVAPDDPAPSSTPGSSQSGGEGSADECEYVQSGTASRQVDLPAVTGVAKTGKVSLTMTTNQGDIKITMDRATTPCTVNSFESLVRQGFYDDTACHRLSDNGLLILQCGDPDGTGRGGPGYTIPDEVTGNETYVAGSVAMANSGQPNTGGSQFFLVYGDSDLAPDYTIFGTMDTTGLGVVNRIAAEGQDGSNPDGTGKPNNPAEIVKITKG